jgi:hypothetical protein
MAWQKADPSARRYRIKPWPIRIGIPFAALVVIAGLIHNHDAALIPIPVVLAVAYVWLAERCGLYVTDRDVESRMTRRANSFRCRWADIDSFELIDNGAQVAVVMQLRDGSRKLLPSTRAWFWDKRRVMQIRAGLLREQTAARAPATG